MYSKPAVNFESPAKGMDHCIACVHYIAGRCELVAGTILPGDWCRLFEKRKSMIQKSPAEINKCECDDAYAQAKAADARSNHPGEGIKEHGLHVTSRTTGKSVEVTFGPQGSGLVPANPFASLAQEGYLHAHPEKLGKTALDEWDSATKGKKLPEHVKKSK